MFRLFQAATGTGTQPDPEPVAPAQPAPASLAVAPVAESPRLRVEHARRLEEEVAALKYELSTQNTHFTSLLREQKRTSDRLARDERAKFSDKIARLQSRCEALEAADAQGKADKARLEARNEQLLANDKARDERLSALDDELFDVKTRAAALRQENREMRAELGTAREDVAQMDGQARDLLASLGRVGERLTRKADALPASSESEDGADFESREATPTGRELLAPDASLSGDTLRTIPSAEQPRTSSISASGPLPTSTSTSAALPRPSIDPRSLDALRTVRPSVGGAERPAGKEKGSGRERGSSPTPSKKKARGVAVAVQTSASRAPSPAARMQGLGQAPTHSHSHSRKRQRTDGDEGV